MNIVILTNSNPFVNAGVVAHNLYDGFIKKGHDVKIIVREYGDYKDKNIISVEKYRDVIIKKVKNRIQKGVKKVLNIRKEKLKCNKYIVHDFDQTIQYYKTNDILKEIAFKPDLFIFLFPQWFLNAKNLYEINKSTKAPIFWYLMDSAPLTGGCHYFWDCKGYITGCGKCPAMNSTLKNDQSYINFNFKKRYLDKTDLHIITGTKRLFNQSKESLLYRSKPIHKILLPIDENIFKPVDKIKLRIKMGLPVKSKILFFGSASLKEERKGMKYLTDALKLIDKNINREDVFLLIAGNHFEFIKEDLDFNYKYLGLLDNNEQLAETFQVSDLFICPSIEDAGPMMINQSIMCGTPVVSFEMGVAFDLVLPKVTGFMAKLFDVKDLAFQITRFLVLDELEEKKMSDNCRSLGLKFLDQDIFVNGLERIFYNI